MEIDFRRRLKEFQRQVRAGLTNLLFVERPGTEKRELRFSRLKWIAVSGVVLFVIVVLFMPEENDLQFSHKGELPSQKHEQSDSNRESSQPPSQSQASSLWGSPKPNYAGSGGGSQANQNTSMIVGLKGGNAKTQLRAGARLPLRFLDKFIVSQDQVPVLAELILDSTTDSGLKLPAGTRLYGEASFQKGAERASVQFKQISLPSGQIRTISGIAAGKDGQPGVPGKVYSDSVKNTAGELLTVFVGGLASGSMQNNIFGQSQGGLQNGLLNAVSQTAQNRAQAYGQKLQNEREWIEVATGQEGDAILTDSINLQEGGDQ